MIPRGRSRSSPEPVYLPVTYDPAAAPPELADWAAWTVSALVFRRLTRRGVRPDDPLPLDWEVLADVVPRAKVKPTLDWLRSSHVLETDGKFWDGHSRRFVLGEPHRAARVRRHWLTGGTACRNIQKARRRLADATEAEPVLAALKRWLTAVTVAGVPADVLDPPAADPDPALQALAAGGEAVWGHPCDFNRFHSPLTSLARPHRRYVLIAGEPPRYVDVGGCQPVLLGLWLRDRGFGGDDWLADALADRLYDRLAARLGLFGAGARDEAKARLLPMLYADGHVLRGDTGKAVESLYPRAYAGLARDKASRNYCELNWEMQRREGAVMLGGAVGRLLARDPHRPVATIHDGILCRRRDEAEVAEAVTAAWRELTGVTPRLKCKWFGGDEVEHSYSESTPPLSCQAFPDSPRQNPTHTHTTTHHHPPTGTHTHTSTVLLRA